MANVRSRLANGPQYLFDLASKFMLRALGSQDLWFGRAHRHSVDHHVAKHLSDLDVDCVIDVGANQGQFALGIRQAGYSGAIISFEPVSETYRTLARVASSDPNWTAHKLALSSAPGTLQINVSGWSEFSSALALLPMSISALPETAPLRVETVPVSTVDEQLCALPYKRIFLKSDTQGLDLAVLEGATETLSRVVGVQIELSVRHIYEDMPDYLETLTHLHDSGYVPTGLFPVTAEPVMEFDGVLVRRDLNDAFAEHGARARKGAVPARRAKPV